MSWLGGMFGSDEVEEEQPNLKTAIDNHFKWAEQTNSNVKRLAEAVVALDKIVQEQSEELRNLKSKMAALAYPKSLEDL